MKKKLAKFNEVKMPLLMQAMFDDVGLPNLIEFQRCFHTELMEGLLTEQENFIK
jgi:hypothetical protein